MGAMHANCYKNIEDVKITAVADVRKEKAEQLAVGASIYGDGMDLINNADVDVIDICLPTYLHAEYAIKAIFDVHAAGLSGNVPVFLWLYRSVSMDETVFGNLCSPDVHWQWNDFYIRNGTSYSLWSTGMAVY